MFQVVYCNILNACFEKHFSQFLPQLASQFSVIIFHDIQMIFISLRFQSRLLKFVILWQDFILCSIDFLVSLLWKHVLKMIVIILMSVVNQRYREITTIFILMSVVNLRYRKITTIFIFVNKWNLNLRQWQLSCYD